MMMFHVSKHCACLTTLIEQQVYNKFPNYKITFVEHQLPDEIYAKENFEEQIEYSSYKKACYIMNQEFIFQPEDSIITFSSGIKKNINEQFGMYINIMFYHNKKFSNSECEIFVIPDKYTHLVHESQSDSTKKFFDNFASDVMETIQWIKKEMNVDVESIILNEFKVLLEKI